MDINFALFNIVAYVGGRRRRKYWWTSHTQTKVNDSRCLKCFIIFSASHRLMNWIQSKVPDLPITNFTTDWNDGKAVGALVDAVAPGLCPDWQVYILRTYIVFVAILKTIYLLGLGSQRLCTKRIRSYGSCR